MQAFEALEQPARLGVDLVKVLRVRIEPQMCRPRIEQRPRQEVVVVHHRAPPPPVVQSVRSIARPPRHFGHLLGMGWTAARNLCG